MPSALRLVHPRLRPRKPYPLQNLNARARRPAVLSASAMASGGGDLRGMDPRKVRARSSPSSRVVSRVQPGIERVHHRPGADPRDEGAMTRLLARRATPGTTMANSTRGTRVVSRYRARARRRAWTATSGETREMGREGLARARRPEANVPRRGRGEKERDTDRRALKSNVVTGAGSGDAKRGERARARG